MTDIEAPKSDNINKILKVLVIGEMGSGKTSIIRQYVQGFFSEFYKSTIGVDFANKTITWDDTTTISLQLWDIAGQERYGTMTHVYYQEATAALVVFDLTKEKTFEMVLNWKNDVDQKVFTADNKPIPCLLLGNKVDLIEEDPSKWQRTDEEMNEYCKTNGFIGFYKTSARLKTNIEEAANFLVKYIIENDIQPQTVSKGVDLKDENKSQSKGCCK